MIAASLDLKISKLANTAAGYAKGLDDVYQDSLAHMTEDEIKTWNISSVMLKQTSGVRLRGMTIREAYDAGLDHARTFDHSVLRAISEYAAVDQMFTPDEGIVIDGPDGYTPALSPEFRRRQRLERPEVFADIPEDDD